MTQSLHVTSTSRNTAQLDEIFVLSEDASKTTRRIIKAEFVENTKDPEAGVRIIISHQRRTKSNSWEDCPPFNLIHVKAGEEIRLELRSGETKRLLQALQTLKAIYDNSGIPWGTAEVVVGTSDKVVLTDPVRAEAMRRLLATNQTQEVWEALVEHAPEALTRLCLGKVQQERVAILDRFCQMLTGDHVENEWQKFFKENTWIFGFGLDYQILGLLTDQPNYGGANVHGQGGQRGDYLMATEADVRFTVLVEIKKPTTALFGPRQYRNGTWSLNAELVGATSQVQTNCQTWGRSAETAENVRALDRQGIFTREPKGILIIGHTNQFSGGGNEDLVKLQTFESYRRNMHNPEILTFDEVYQRAKFIVDHGAQPAAPAMSEPFAIEEEENTDDLPF